jgi:hypothetical protein
MTLQRHLLDYFGGYTEHHAIGAWRDPATGKVYHDNSAVFTVAVEATNASSMRALTHMAKTCGALAGQICVYVRGFDGEVELISCV